MKGWDIRCKTCDRWVLELGIGGSKEVAEAIVDHAVAVIALGRAGMVIHIPTPFDGKQVRVDYESLAQHAGHRVMALFNDNTWTDPDLVREA